MRMKSLLLKADRYLRSIGIWGQRLFSAGIGVIATLALPPFSWTSCLFIAIPLWLYLLEIQPTKRLAFWIGWWFGFGYFTSNIYWIAFSFGVDLKSFAWLIPFTVFGLPSCCGFYLALVGLGAHSLPFKGLSKVLCVAVLWGIAEGLRGVLWTGFPWNLLSYSIMDYPSCLQAASLLGAYGLSMLTFLACSFLFFVFLPGLQTLERYGSVLGLVLMVGSFTGWGYSRMKNSSPAFVEGIYLRLVQPNISQKEKWQRHRSDEHFDKLIALSTMARARMPTHIIWPESAAPYFYEQDPVHRARVADAAPQHGAILLGAPRLYRSGSEYKIWNSFLAIRDTGEIEATYDKSHLVPFGEYIPLRKFIPKTVKKITAGGVDFTPGTGVQTVKLRDLPPFSPLICYEGIFPGQVVNPALIRPQWLLNLTNDAWFGPTSGPYQHLAITRMRAIEEGLPLIRVANTGISGVIDAYGRVLSQLNLNETGILDTALPQALEGTIYALYGNWMAVVLGIILIAFSIVLHYLRPVGNKKT